MPGLNSPLLSKAHLTPMLLFQIFVGKHHSHQIALFHADAMLAAEHAAHRNTQAQDVRAKGFGPFQLIVFHGVEHDQRMQIAIARVKHIADPQSVLFRQGRDFFQHAGQRLPRNGAVHAQHVGGQPPHRGKRGLAACPQPGTFRLAQHFLGPAASGPQWR